MIDAQSLCYQCAINILYSCCVCAGCRNTVTPNALHAIAMKLPPYAMNMLSLRYQYAVDLLLLICYQCAIHMLSMLISMNLWPLLYALVEPCASAIIPLESYRYDVVPTMCGSRTSTSRLTRNARYIDADRGCINAAAKCAAV